MPREMPRSVSGLSSSEWQGVTVILLTTFVVVLLATAIYGLFIAAHIAKEIVLAAISAAATLMTALSTYLFSRMKELEMAGVQRLRELEVQERKTKQQNYERIIEGLAPFIRDKNTARDQFATAYLFTWIAGSESVVEKMHEFVHEPNAATLDRVLLEMRDDLAILSNSTRFNGWGASTRDLFPEQVILKPGLSQGAAHEDVNKRHP